MIYRLYFSYLSLKKKKEQIRQSGSVISSRSVNGRIVYLYLLHSFFIEVWYREDDKEGEIEAFHIFTSYEELNSYLTTEI